MDEIIPGLWIGDLPSALKVEKLKAHKIFSILSAMRGRITIHETFIRHQILLDDTEEEDILIHFLPSIHFIQEELDKNRGVLVHCQAGISRSATIVAAYLMYSRNMDTASALELIKSKRPNVEPNQNFLQQLELFHSAQYKISPRDKATRMFYMNRAVEEVMNGDGSLPDTDMFAKYPRTPSDSVPPTPGGPRRRIRCKMCRQELAAREHMLDHGQLGPATPAMTTPDGSRRPSVNQVQPSSRRPSTNQPRSRLGSSNELTGGRRPSLFSFGAGESLQMSSMETEVVPEDEVVETVVSEVTTSDTPQGQVTSIAARRLSGGQGLSLRSLRSMSSTMGASLSMSALEDDDDDAEPNLVPSPSQLTPTVNGAPAPLSSFEAAKLLGRRLSEAMISTSVDVETPTVEVPVTAEDGSSKVDEAPSVPSSKEPHTGQFVNPIDLAERLYSNPKLAGLRGPPQTTTVSYGSRPATPPVSAPILANSKCSGYFVEPMKWMEPFLESGQLAGKIVCPNKKCGAKLGNYDWAGVCCGCKEWVTPGFCINRSKVDEVV